MSFQSMDYIFTNSLVAKFTSVLCKHVNDIFKHVYYTSIFNFQAKLSYLVNVLVSFQFSFFRDYQRSTN